MNNNNRKITFISGTRADFGKLRPLIECLYNSGDFSVEIIATGMHLLKKYGYTINEIYKAGFDSVFPIFNQESSVSEKMDITVANTIIPLSHYINERDPDLIVIHGDRVEALAGVIAGSLNNVAVAHIEGGEISGTIDESIRHAVSKLAHYHFVSNENSKKRLLQMGEEEDRIFVIGSPEVDIMEGGNLPTIEEALSRYSVPFNSYGLVIYHPVTTDATNTEGKINEVISALEVRDDNYIIIGPNNDLGSAIIYNSLFEFSERENVKFFPSVRFEYYLTFLSHAKYILGNSSSGVREAPVFGVPTINIGNRQGRRNQSENIFNCGENATAISNAINQIPNRVPVSRSFGDGNSAVNFVKILKRDSLWNKQIQKIFVELKVD